MLGSTPSCPALGPGHQHAQRIAAEHRAPDGQRLRITAPEPPTEAATSTAQPGTVAPFPVPWLPEISCSAAASLR